MNALKRGVSWSGREPNRCFLNLGNSKFSDISGVSGLDSEGDGRAAAIVDWDRDGDLDIWLTNRTAPRLSLLRNNIGQENHFVAFKLVGTTCNRDSIGARLALRATSTKDGTRKYVDSARAGDGFLGQSSKTVHFGLGSAAPESLTLTVSWPGGDKQEFKLPGIDRLYEVTQGDVAVDVSAARGKPIDLAEAGFGKPGTTQRRRIWMAYRKELPALTIRDADGESVVLNEVSPDQPRLIMMWNQTCLPCLEELREVAEKVDAIKSAGLAVSAVHLNEPDQAAEDEQKAMAILQRMEFPFHAAIMEDSLQARVVELLEDRLARHFEFALPTSFLVDSQGRLAVVYRGPFDLSLVLEDVSQLDDQQSSDLDKAAPFLGRWLQFPDGGE